MKFKTEAVVTGIKFFNDDIDGKRYDTTTVYALVGLDESQKRAKGQAGESFKCQTSALYKKLEGFDFPLNCELTLQQVTTGKIMKVELLDVRPLVPSAQAKPGQA